MPNRLAHETSPYLLQHAENPVDWHPWGLEALERARREDRPILLSIGYAACHWCHVMEHESFEDEATAQLMNEHFVNIKVDREERPDIDSIYMQAVQALTGHGGWPMTVFLTPDRVPFFAGTYFPNVERHGMPSFARVLRAVADAYRTRRADVAKTTEQVRQLFAASTLPARSGGPLTPALLDRAFRGLAEQYDETHGGFGSAPKFPAAMALDHLVRYWARTGESKALRMAMDSFRAMARGGIHDQIGGGFARYAVDDRWLVPHFEKMLYDNALIATLGVHLWQATHDEEVGRVTRDTLDWALREMLASDGGFYSSLDADTEGHEGRFYIWTPAEIAAAVGEVAEASLVTEYWGATAEGNFEGANILQVAHDPASFATRHGLTLDHLASVLERARAALYAARARRVWPARDDKILAAWNGLMLRAVALAARVLRDERYRVQAVRTGEFLFRALVRNGRVFRSYKDGAARIPGFLEDHAALGLAALALYELTFDRVWLDRATMLAERSVESFWDGATGAFFDTPRDQEDLVSRPRDATDNATPSGTSLACDLLVRLAELRHDAEMRRQAAFVLETIAEPMAHYPSAFGHALQVADMLVHGAVELAIVGDPGASDFDSLVRVAAERYVPALVLAGGSPGQGTAVPLLADRPVVEGRATAYVCRDFTCDAPVTTPEALVAQLAAAAGG